MKFISSEMYHFFGYEGNFQKPTRHPERSKCIKKYDVTIKLPRNEPNA